MTESQTREAQLKRWAKMLRLDASGEDGRMDMGEMYRLAEWLEAQSSQTVRLRELAKIGARVQHSEVWRYDYPGRDHKGHDQIDFATCPHPDCLLIREAEREKS
jgi:hypothetical protein